jgi:hypothetical protein
MHAFLLHGGDAPWESLIFMAVVAVLGIAGLYHSDRFGYESSHPKGAFRYEQSS